MAGPALVLVGLPGGGKTTVGARLGEVMNLPAIDTDALVAHRAGVDPEHAFVDLGEERFRALETQVVREVIGKEAGPGVVALGSGALAGPTGAQHRDLLMAARRRGTRVVDLHVRLAQAAPRSGLLGPQPVGLGAPRAMLAEFARLRRPLYLAVAELTMDTTGRQIDEVARALRAWLADGTLPEGATEVS